MMSIPSSDVASSEIAAPKEKAQKVYPSTQQREILACSALQHEAKTLVDSAKTVDGFRALVDSGKSLSSCHDKIKKKLASQTVVYTLSYEPQGGSGARAFHDLLVDRDSSAPTELAERGKSLLSEIEQFEPKFT